MDEKMEFPNTLDEFIRQYSFIDEEQIYTNGIELIPVFRIRQWEEHKKEENQGLKKQLEYLHCGEYLNQLRFERNMLQDVVDKMEVSKEDKRFIDMTHRNTELLEENRKLEEQLEVGEQQYNDLVEEKEELQEQLSNSHQINAQQKEFIEWLEQNIENEEYCYLASNPGERCRKDVFEEVLSKYKEIIGYSE